jgi:hypothetical protein
VSQWTYEYPWGKKSPQQRISDLGRRRDEIALRRRKLEERYRERLIDFDRQIEAVEAELEIARRCERDRLRRRCREVAFRLLDLGSDVFARIEASEPDEALLTELLTLEREAREAAPALNPDAARTDAHDTTSSVPEDVLDEEVVSADDLDIFLDTPEHKGS